MTWIHKCMLHLGLFSSKLRYRVDQHHHCCCASVSPMAVYKNVLCLRASRPTRRQSEMYVNNKRVGPSNRYTDRRSARKKKGRNAHASSQYLHEHTARTRHGNGSGNVCASSASSWIKKSSWWYFTHIVFLCWRWLFEIYLFSTFPFSFYRTNDERLALCGGLCRSQLFSNYFNALCNFWKSVCLAHCGTTMSWGFFFDTQQWIIVYSQPTRKLTVERQRSIFLALKCNWTWIWTIYNKCCRVEFLWCATLAWFVGVWKSSCGEWLRIASSKEKWDIVSLIF